MNPFIQNFKLKAVKVIDKYNETRTSDISDGVVGKYKTVTEWYLAEQQEKVSVYDISYIENILFQELKSSGRDMLLYIIYNLKKDTDTIDLPIEKVCKKISISRGTYYNGVTQLIDVGIICKKQTTTYWINPFYIFKGNRINYYNKQNPDLIEIVAAVNQDK